MEILDDAAAMATAPGLSMYKLQAMYHQIKDCIQWFHHQKSLLLYHLKISLSTV